MSNKVFTVEYINREGLTWKTLPVSWHERMRLEFDIDYMVCRVRTWRGWLYDITYRRIRAFVFRNLHDKGFLEVPKGAIPFNIRYLRLRWWHVLRRRRERQC